MIDSRLFAACAALLCSITALAAGPGATRYRVVEVPEPQFTGASCLSGYARRFTATGLKVMFALICDPALANATHRKIAAAAGVALGAVPAILQGLQTTGALLVMGKERRLDATKRLLDEWALAYAQRLRPKTLRTIYETPHFDRWRDWNLEEPDVRWGGEPAAQLLVGHLRPGILTLYADKLPPRLMLEQRFTVAMHGQRTRFLELRRPFWGAPLNQFVIAPQTTPPALVYADLLATGDGRCIETAHLLHEEHLARLFPAR